MTNNLRLIPSLFTLLNFFWGIFAIIKVLEGNLDTAAWFIILAILCDGMDGKLARWTSSETPFGVELDSLADLISSGLAPAILAYEGGLNRIGIAGFILCFTYVFAGGYRLARFNVVQAGDRSQGYTGLPIPIAGLTVSALWLFETPWSDGIKESVLGPLMLLLPLLMMSTIHFDWPRISFKESWKRSALSSGILLGVLMMAIIPKWSLFPLFMLFILIAVWNWTCALIRGEVRFADFFLVTTRH